MTFEPGLMTDFKPTESLLLRVGNPGYRETCQETEHYGVVFDPWTKGDPVVVMAKSPKRGERWRYGIRASTPSASVLKIDVGIENPVSVGPRSMAAYAVELYRIPHKWRKAAASLAGRTFSSREEVEKAMREAK